MLPCQFVEDLFTSIEEFVDTHVTHPDDDIIDGMDFDSIVDVCLNLTAYPEKLAEIIAYDLDTSDEFILCPECNTLGLAEWDKDSTPCPYCGKELDDTIPLDTPLDVLLSEDNLEMFSKDYLIEMLERYFVWGRNTTDCYIVPIIPHHGPEEIAINVMSGLTSPDFQTFIGALHNALSLHHHGGWMFDDKLGYGVSKELTAKVDQCRREGIKTVWTAYGLRVMHKCRPTMPEEYVCFLDHFND